MSSPSQQRPDDVPVNPPSSPGSRPWVAPVVTELPKLTDLTLQTGGPIGGGGGGGSTVF